MVVVLGADCSVKAVEEFDSPPPTNMFELSEKEAETANAWMEKHREEHKVGPFGCGAIGGRWSYKFTPTGLGIIKVIQCFCGEEECLTDFDDW
tara:strand:+ start:342 stop:620 length:279 start_codon:yes stop_codon:yes gene_type:complete